MPRGCTKTENALKVVPDRRENTPVALRRGSPGEQAFRAFGDLPLELLSFVGRARELEEVGRLLSGSRLLTLTGAGGSGKTRLALEAAGIWLGRSRTGRAWWSSPPFRTPTCWRGRWPARWGCEISRTSRHPRLSYATSILGRCFWSWTTASTWWTPARGWPRSYCAPARTFG